MVGMMLPLATKPPAYIVEDAYMLRKEMVVEPISYVLLAKPTGVIDPESCAMDDKVPFTSSDAAGAIVPIPTRCDAEMTVRVLLSK